RRPVFRARRPREIPMNHVRNRAGALPVVLRLLACALSCTLAGLLAQAASAEVVRFGKPVAGAFTFALLDVGVRAGIFKKHGLDLEISAFTGGTRLVQAETAGSIDIAFNTGPDMAMIFKGAPVRAIALVSDSPLDLCLLVRPDLPVAAPSDLKGRRITVS